MPDMMIPHDYDRDLMEINSVDDVSDKEDNNDKILPDVSCEATDLDGLNNYIGVMDSKGTDSEEGVRENVSQRYNTIIPKKHSDTLILKNNVSTIKDKLIMKINNGNDITIDGQGHTINLTGSSKHDHYFVVKSGHVTFKNINFINGYNKDGDNGGAISFEGNAVATLINCTFQNCWIENNGGAIADRTGNTLTLINCTFSGNSVRDADGGAIDTESDMASTFKRCIFKSNSAGDDKGGAIFSNGLLIIEDCLFESNKAYVDGGAIFCKKDVKIIRSVFLSNMASGAKTIQCYGGAIRAKGTVHIDNSTFENNTSEDYGGAVYAETIKINQNQGKQSINTFFIGNKAADNDGGALFASDNVFAKNALFRGNKAYVDGGAIFADDVTSDNCLFIANKASGATFSQCFGGAIRAKDTAYIDNSTFENNTSEDYGGVVYADYIMINQNQSGKDFSSFFFGNKAGDNDGGALYSTKDVSAKNAVFRGNKAYQFGGAICIDGDNSKAVVLLNNCLFESNKAKGAKFNECYGGAVCTEGTANINNCTFNKNSSEYGGAIYAKKLKGSNNHFNGNSASYSGDDYYGGSGNSESFY